MLAHPAPESADLIAGLPERDQGTILESLPDDVVTDLIQEAGDDHAQDYVELLSDEKKDAAEQLLGFPEDSAGGRMTTAYASLHEDMTIREAIASLDEIKDDAEILARIYVVDDAGRTPDPAVAGNPPGTDRHGIAPRDNMGRHGVVLVEFDFDLDPLFVIGLLKQRDLLVELSPRDRAESTEGSGL